MWLAFQQNRHNYRYSICWWMIWKGKSTRRSSLPHRSGAHDGVIAHAAYSNHRRVWEKVTKCFFFFCGGVLFKSTGNHTHWVPLKPLFFPISRPPTAAPGKKKKIWNFFPTLLSPSFVSIDAKKKERKKSCNRSDRTGEQKGLTKRDSASVCWERNEIPKRRRR